MQRRYSWTDILALFEDLQAFAWSAPMRDLAPKLGMSDVGLKKALVACGVTPPPQGYWNKLRAGKPVPTQPKAPPRRPGEIGRLSVPTSFRAVVPEAQRLPSTGPFATANVPEDLEELRAAELKAIGQPAVPKSLDRAHRGLLKLIKQEERRREKAAASGWSWDEPKFDNPLGKRRLRLLNAIFFGLTKRGQEGNAYERDGEIHATALVGDTQVTLQISIVGTHRTIRQYGYVRPAPDLPATTPLMLRIGSGEEAETYQDDAAGKLESKLGPVIAAIIVVGEATFRNGLREAERREEESRIAREKRRLDKLARLNEKRLEDLRTSGELLRQAQEIRGLVRSVRDAMLAGQVEVGEIELAEWERWALGEADRIDPVASGHVMNHLRPPVLAPDDSAWS